MEDLKRWRTIIYFILIVVGLGFYTYWKYIAPPKPPSTASSQTKYPQPFPLHRAELSTFLNAIEVAGLGDMFRGTGPFTGFIPTNAAFEKLGVSQVEELLKPENKDQLAAILTYHMVPGKYKSDALQSTRLQTVNGKYLDIKVQDHKITVNNAKVVKADLEGPNWNVYEIDTVLIP